MLVPYFRNLTFIPEEEALSLKLKCVNWPHEYPYAPEVKATLWHDGTNLYIRFDVTEEFIAGTALNDNDKVSKDSCVEFFISFDSSGYYNLEANCCGKILLSHRKGRKIDVEYAPNEVLKNIERKPSLGSKPFDCRKADQPWHLELKIPISTFFKHKFKSFSGLKSRCNIYKCGDNLPVPHFVTLSPISTENPDFHRPEFFIPLTFQDIDR